MRHLLTTSLALLTCGSLPAQLSGTFSINPAGGMGVFTSFQEAVNALFVNGINGPVTIAVLPGTYTESILVPPIPGASAANTITFLAAAGPGSVTLVGNGGDTFAFLGVGFAQNGNFVFDGLVFDNAPGFAISATRFVENMEIKNCEFRPEHRPTAAGEFRHAIIVSENSGNEAGWSVHDNKFTFPSRTNRTAYGIYMSNQGGWDIFNNEFDINGADYGLYMINNNRSIDRVYNNLFFGDLRNTTSTNSNSTVAIRADISNYENEFTHNTFLINVPGTTGSAIATGGFVSGGNPIENRIFGNIIMVTGPGTCITVNQFSGQPAQPFTSDGNLLWAPGGEIGRIGPNNPGETMLATWQANSGQGANSIQADPMFVNGVMAPFDLHPQPGSPVQNAATGTPAFVTDDFDGRPRDLMPDIGAYEMSGFGIYGMGCAGTGGLVPTIASSGTIAIPSTNFTVDLSNALPGSLAIMIGGFSREQFGAQTLPLNIGGGCSILAAPQLTLFTATDGAGNASVPFNIPNNPILAGAEVYFQWAVADPMAGSMFGIATSNGGSLNL